jgi:hypothetical protein
VNYLLSCDKHNNVELKTNVPEISSAFVIRVFSDEAELKIDTVDPLRRFNII